MLLFGFLGQSHTCKLPFDQLKSIKIEEMQVPNIHKGRYLIGRTIVEPFASISMQTLIEDLNGKRRDLQVKKFNFFHFFEYLNSRLSDSNIFRRRPTTSNLQLLSEFK